MLTLTLLHDTLVKQLDSRLGKNRNAISSFLVRQRPTPPTIRFSERYYGALLSRDGQIIIDTNPVGDRPRPAAIAPDEAAAVEAERLLCPRHRRAATAGGSSSTRCKIGRAPSPSR